MVSNSREKVEMGEHLWSHGPIIEILLPRTYNTPACARDRRSTAPRARVQVRAVRWALRGGRALFYVLHVNIRLRDNARRARVAFTAAFDEARPFHQPLSRPTVPY